MGVLGMIAGQAAGAGIGLALQGVNDRRQLKQQQKLQDMQVKGQMEMGRFNQAQQLDMWNKTNVGAQVDHYKKAGMNPALMYGMGGGGGTTTGNAGGTVSGGAAPSGGGEVGMGLQTAAQLELLRAQKENIQADTENKKAGATKTAGVDTENVAADTANKQATTKLTGVETEMREIGKRVAYETEGHAMDAIKSSAAKLRNEADLARTNAVINERTYEEQISKIKSESIGAMLHNNAVRAGINLTNEQAAKIAVELEQKWKDLELTGRGQDMTQENVEKQVNGLLMAAGINAVGNLTGTTMRGITDMLKSKRGTTTETSSSRQDGRGNWTDTQTKTTTKGN